MTSRLEHGVWIAVNRRIVPHKDGNAWFVQSESHADFFYKVTEDGHCECPDNALFNHICKHVYAIMVKDAIPRLEREIANG